MSAKLRIVLLEDQEDVRSVLSEALECRGYEVFSFSTPAICPLQKLPECRCMDNQRCTDVVIADIDMPGMSGLDFIENQKNKNCKCRHVALMSGSWSGEGLLRARELGCKILMKPFPFDEFYVWLDEIERHTDPTRELRNWFQNPG